MQPPEPPPPFQSARRWHARPEPRPLQLSDHPQPLSLRPTPNNRPQQLQNAKWIASPQPPKTRDAEPDQQNRHNVLNVNVPSPGEACGTLKVVFSNGFIVP